MGRLFALDQAKRARKLWREAWFDFGGWAGVGLSPYFWLACVLTVGCYRLWLAPGWWDASFAIVPSLLGFSIGGFAIFLAFGDDRFRRLISGADDDGRASPFIAVCVQFTHFVVVQVGALMFALVAKAVTSLGCDAVNHVLGAAGVAALFYALLLALAAVASLLKLARGYDKFVARAKAEAEASPRHTEPKS